MDAESKALTRTESLHEERRTTAESVDALNEVQVFRCSRTMSRTFLSRTGNRVKGRLFLEHPQ